MESQSDHGSVVLSENDVVAGFCAQGGARVVTHAVHSRAPFDSAVRARDWLVQRVDSHWEVQPEGLVDADTGASVLCVDLPTPKPAVATLLTTGPVEVLLREVVFPTVGRHLAWLSTPTPQPRRPAHQKGPTQVPLSALAYLLRRHAGHVAVYSGAGLSVAGGIPSLRGPGGLADLAGADLAGLTSLPRRMLTNPARLLDLCGLIERTARTARPTPGHEAVAKLARAGIVSHVWTSNIDRLHEATGLGPQHLDQQEQVDTTHLDLLLLLGVSGDERGLVDTTRRAGRLIASIDISADEASVRGADIWVKADVQNALPALVRHLGIPGG